jgi:hypothetical protein
MTTNCSQTTRKIPLNTTMAHKEKGKDGKGAKEGGRKEGDVERGNTI